LQLALVIVFMACVAAWSPARADDALCDDKSKTLKEFFERPWAEIEHSPIGEQVHRVRLESLCQFTEAQLLEYFVSGPESIPKVTTEVRFGSREPFERTRLFRTWDFPGLSIDGEVSGDTSICPDRIALTSSEVRLVCGLGVGSKLRDFEARLGEPTKRKSSNERVSLRYVIETGLGIDYSIELDAGADEKVTSIIWSIPRTH
jgi:hypothetical protein